MKPETLASMFHETYERLAPNFGWETKENCRVSFDELPERNKKLMIATCNYVLNALQESRNGGTSTNSASKQCLCVDCKHPSCGAKKPRGEFIPFVWGCDNFIA